MIINRHKVTETAQQHEEMKHRMVAPDLTYTVQNGSNGIGEAATYQPPKAMVRQIFL